MTTRGFKSNWRRAKAAYRNATGGYKTTTRKRLVRLVADELRKEIARP